MAAKIHDRIERKSYDRMQCEIERGNRQWNQAGARGHRVKSSEVIDDESERRETRYTIKSIDGIQGRIECKDRLQTMRLRGERQVR